MPGPERGNPLKADLHIHTHHSHDSFLSKEAIIAACMRRGIHCIAIADHNSIAGALEVREAAPFTVIVGEEIRSLSGEVTGLFLTEEIPPHLSAPETVARIKAQGGLVYIPHPFDRLRRSPLRREALEYILPQVDIIEVFNSRSLLGDDCRRARRFALEHGLVMGAGSDAHIASEIGNAYVEMAEFNDKEGFLAALSQGQIVGRGAGLWVHLATRWAKYQKRAIRA